MLKERIMKDIENNKIREGTLQKSQIVAIALDSSDL